IGRIRIGSRMFQEMLTPQKDDSQPGMIRRAPSGQPMYQSGCDPAVTFEGSYGPYFHRGLIVIRPPMRAVAPKTMKKKPPALAAYTGSIGKPTTFCSVRPGPGH